MMCVTSLVTASKERQTGAKSCKAGKPHSADEIISFKLTSVNIASASSGRVVRHTLRRCACSLSAHLLSTYDEAFIAADYPRSARRHRG